MIGNCSLGHNSLFSALLKLLYRVYLSLFLGTLRVGGDIHHSLMNTFIRGFKLGVQPKCGVETEKCGVQN